MKGRIVVLTNNLTGYRQAKGLLRRNRLALCVAVQGVLNVADNERNLLNAREATTGSP